jgi:3-hydroxybutyryl-CoA dehydrogenase
MQQREMKIAIAGAGLMGSGIAICSVLAGYKTLLFDINADALQKGRDYIFSEIQKSAEKRRISPSVAQEAMALLSVSTNKEDLVADLILEAVLEKKEIKVDLFSALQMQNAENCILATNTSSIPITQIAAPLKRPQNVVGIHFFNPAHIMKLVEIIAGAATDEKIIDQANKWALSLGKTTVLAKDAPGFIVNRVARHYYVEGLKLAEEQLADFKSIDRLCESAGFKMGPFKLMDLIGVDTNFAVTSSMYEQFQYDAKFRPNRIQKQKVDAGYHGRKTGKGFYDYENP